MILYGNTFKSVITRCDKDQAECVENTQTLPQRDQCSHTAKDFGWKKPFEGGAGTVPLHRRGERSLKPSIFCLAGAKDAVFWIQKPELTVFSTLNRIFLETPYNSIDLDR
jgi:hypothetical protein